MPEIVDKTENSLGAKLKNKAGEKKYSTIINWSASQNLLRQRQA
jgi:hypothetical protein